MPNASAASAGLFSGLVLGVVVVVVLGLRRAGVGRVPTAAVLLAYVGVPGVLARLGALDRYDPPPAPALALLVGLTALTVAAVLSRLGAGLAAGVGLGGVVALQAFRIPVELLLHRLYAEGEVP